MGAFPRINGKDLIFFVSCVCEAEPDRIIAFAIIITLYGVRIYVEDYVLLDRF